MAAHPLEPMRRKEPISKLIEESFTALDHVLGYLTLKMRDHPLFSVYEQQILDIFERLLTLQDNLQKIIPPDDF